jgi:hypothetical protein
MAPHGERVFHDWTEGVVDETLGWSMALVLGVVIVLVVVELGLRHFKRGRPVAKLKGLILLCIPQSCQSQHTSQSATLRRLPLVSTALAAHPLFCDRSSHAVIPHEAVLGGMGQFSDGGWADIDGQVAKNQLWSGTLNIFSEADAVGRRWDGSTARAVQIRKKYNSLGSSQSGCRNRGSGRRALQATSQGPSVRTQLVVAACRQLVLPKNPLRTCWGLYTLVGEQDKTLQFSFTKYGS